MHAHPDHGTDVVAIPVNEETRRADTRRALIVDPSNPASWMNTPDKRFQPAGNPTPFGVRGHSTDGIGQTGGRP